MQYKLDKILFAGTPDFAASIFQVLLDAKKPIMGVLTQPDRPKGRGQKVEASPVKQIGLQHELPIYQPASLKDTFAQQLLRDLAPDLIIVVAYGLILPAEVLSIPRYGCINVHASLLPRWRGAAPIPRAILAGDTRTGVSIMQMDVGLDTGPVWLEASCDITPQQSSLELQQELANLGAKALLQVLNGLSTGGADFKLKSQDETYACYAEKIKKDEARMQWQNDAAMLALQVRAYNPWPVVYTYKEGKTIRIWEAQEIPALTERDANPGMIVNVDKQGIDVATGTGTLRLLRLQLPGGRPLLASELLNAKRFWFEEGSYFESEYKE